MNRMKVLLGLGIVLAFVFALAACDSERYTPLIPTDKSATVHDTVVQFDTLIQIDTLVQYDTMLVYDTILIELPPDTIIVVDTLKQYDTMVIIDSIFIHDTTYIYIYEIMWIYDTTFIVDTVYDTTLIQDTVIVVDTVYQYIIETDTVWLSNVEHYEKAYWILEWTKLSDTVQLHNPAGKYLVMFDRRTLGVKPDSLEPIVRIAGHKKFFQVYGPNVEFNSIGPIDVPANTEVIIEFIKPYYGKVSGTECHDFIEGLHWFFINADSIRVGN